MWALEVNNLTKSFPQGFWGQPYPVLKDISFKIRSGVCTGFVGVNGSGKTTTLKSVLGFLKPQSGKIHWNLEAQDFREKLGYLPERPYFYEFLSAHEFLHFHWSLAHKTSQRGNHKDNQRNKIIFQRSGAETDSNCKKYFSQTADSCLNKVGLQNVGNKKLRSFSKGMLQRLGIAQAILCNPDFLVLDEPMSGLDPDGRLLVKSILFQQKAAGKTLFFSSHLLSDMQELCEDLLVIDKGKIIYCDRLENFPIERNESFDSAFARFRKNHKGHSL